jgi:PBP1b-binding outer membrane lipoprotein LpoB
MKKTKITFLLVTALLIFASCQSTDECEKYHQKMQAAAQSTLVQDQAACEGNQICLELMNDVYIDQMSIAQNCYQCCVQHLNCETCPAFSDN